MIQRALKQQGGCSIEGENMTNDFDHKILICVDCGEEFIFTIGAQEYFAEKGYTEDPKRCKHCYMIHKRGKKDVRPEEVLPEAGVGGNSDGQHSSAST
jgi:hypothetical protein